MKIDDLVHRDEVRGIIILALVGMVVSASCSYTIGNEVGRNKAYKELGYEISTITTLVRK